MKTSLVSTQPRPQAYFRHLSERKRLGAERDSEKAWHKMGKKSQFSEKKSQTLLYKNLLFVARVEEYFGCISYIRPSEHSRIIVDGIKLGTQPSSAILGLPFIAWRPRRVLPTSNG